jgi:DDE superfamily endonuclease
MEDVLEVYQRPHDPARPVVCLDETSKQLISQTRVPIAAKPGRPARHDYEYERNGTANLFMMFAPLEGWRQVKVTDHHPAVDYAQVLKDLADTHFPNAAQIVLVQDNLSTHKPASLYQAFPAAEARRLVERFEWHYTPHARRLVGHGRTGDQRAVTPVPQQADPHQASPDRGSRRVAGKPQQTSHQGRLAVHHC